jgi:hypothetical protein
MEREREKGKLIMYLCTNVCTYEEKNETEREKKGIIQGGGEEKMEK